MPNLPQKAIELALAQNWNEAILTNKKLLEEDDKNIDALNRLAYALVKIGKIEKAKKVYRSIISLDKYNYIAQKNLDKISSLKDAERVSNSPVRTTLSPNQFLEEPGKTKSVNLINIAPLNIISKIDIGDSVMLYPKKHSIEIRVDNKTYLGALPDDIAFRLLKFLKAGNTYQTCIKNTQKKSVSVFIREVKRGKRFAAQPTFMTVSHEWSHSTPRGLQKSFKTEDEDSQEPEDETEV